MLTIGDAGGIRLRVLELGAAVQHLWVPFGSGEPVDVVVGLDDPADYARTPSDYLGAVVGRVANRIRGGRLVVGGTTHQLAVNEGPNTLHGGPVGFHARRWSVVDRGLRHVTLELVSPDGDQGFPGTLAARVTYRISDAEVSTELEATTDALTPVNLAQHSYVNLAGSGTITDHTLLVAADRYTPVGEDGLPVGDHAEVAGSRFDLRAPTPLAEVIGSGGLDHNFVLAGTPAAVLAHPATGRSVSVLTDRPGLQVFTGDAFHNDLPSYAGIALETQAFPDSPAHEGQPGWPSILLEPGVTWRSTTRWRFEAGAPAAV